MKINSEYRSFTSLRMTIVTVLLAMTVGAISWAGDGEKPGEHHDDPREPIQEEGASKPQRHFKGDIADVIDTAEWEELLRRIREAFPPEATDTRPDPTNFAQHSQEVGRLLLNHLIGHYEQRTGLIADQHIKKAFQGLVEQISSGRFSLDNGTCSFFFHKMASIEGWIADTDTALRILEVSSQYLTVDGVLTKAGAQQLEAIGKEINGVLDSIMYKFVLASTSTENLKAAGEHLELLQLSLRNITELYADKILDLIDTLKTSPTFKVGVIDPKVVRMVDGAPLIMEVRVSAGRFRWCSDEAIFSSALAYLDRYESATRKASRAHQHVGATETTQKLRWQRFREWWSRPPKNTASVAEYDTSRVTVNLDGTVSSGAESPAESIARGFEGGVERTARILGVPRATGEIDRVEMTGSEVGNGKWTALLTRMRNFGIRGKK